MKNLDNQIVVSIQCMAYNHAPYIRQCLDGFVMQKTNFRFEAIIHDDASTDGTQDIIREYEQKYPDIIKPIYQNENQYSKGIPGYITNLVTQKCKGKYIAICEGDDYWIDPLKLQKQVDILEGNPNISMVYTAFSNVDQYGNIITRDIYEQFMKESSSGNNLKRIFEGNYILTLTTCFRKTVYESELFSYSPSKVDYSLFMAASFMGDVFYIPEKTGCYRCNPNSMISTKPKVIYDAVELSKKYYIKKFYQGLCKKNMTIRETKEIKETIFFQRMYKKDIKTILYIVCSDFYTFKLLFIYIFNQLKSIAKYILTIPWKESCKND